MKQKRYWLRGLLAGIGIYILAIAAVYIAAFHDEWGPGLAMMVAGMYLSPLIIIGLVIGWIWGRVKKTIHE